jgi:transposase
MGGNEEPAEVLAAKFAVVFPHLDERQRRLLMGAEARALGHGGIRLVARAAGVREATVSLGVDELDSGAEPLGRARRPGGGRKRAADLDPGLRPALLALVEPDERGDPVSPLRWTTKSTRNLAAELTGQGHKVSADTVGDLLRAEGFSLQGNAKTVEGKQHPDRDLQFRYINEQARAHQGTADPVISVDTKKKELVGEFANAGRQWRPKGRPPAVLVHDFPGDGLGKAVPYGIYDITANAGWVSAGTDHDTAAFAVESVRRWWGGGRPGRLPAGHQAADHRGRRRVQRLPHPGMEGRAGRPGRRDRAGGHRLPLPARDVEVEQGRAPAVLPHHDELAGTATDQPRGRRAGHRRDHDPHRAARAR